MSVSLAVVSDGPSRGVHPAAAVFPNIEGDEFAQLVDSIRDRGLDQDIVLDNTGRVLDGRNRLRACQQAGVEPRFTHYLGDDPVDFVRRANLRRRDLTPGQRAAIAIELGEMDAQAAAKNRQRDAGRRYGERHPQELCTNWSKPLPRTDKVLAGQAGVGSTTIHTDKVLAEQAGVGSTTIYRVRRTKREDPELYEKIRAGEVSTFDAEQRINKARPPKARPPKQSAVAAVPGLSKTVDANQRRVVEARQLASSGHTAAQIAATLGMSEESTRHLCKRAGIPLAANALLGRRRRIDSNRIVGETVTSLEGLAMGIDLIDFDQIDATRIGSWVASLSNSLRSLNRLHKQLKEATP